HPREATARLVGDPAACLGVQPGGLHQIAVDVELLLVRGAITDAHWPRAVVPVEIELALGRLIAAVEPVENLQTRLGQLRGVQQPPEEGLGLTGTSKSQKCVQRERRGTNPTETIGLGA